MHSIRKIASIGCVRYLVEAGADATIPNAEGKTAIDIVKESGRGRFLKIIRGE